MDDSEYALKTLCCTCLCRDRKLYQLCRLTDGVNNLYSLLSYDQEAYKEGFYKDTASLHICWECKAVMHRISEFQQQACSVQRQLTDIADGRTDIKRLNTCLSRLKTTVKQDYDVTVSYYNDENFIDCGPASDDDDVPLSELVAEVEVAREVVKPRFKPKVKLKKKTASKNSLSPNKYKEYFTTKEMTHEEMVTSREVMRKELLLDVPYKCDSCVLVFKTDIKLEGHNEEFHTKKENHSQCPTCLSFTPEDSLASHIQSHSIIHSCNLCGHIAPSLEDARRHIKEQHRDKKSLQNACSTPKAKRRRMPTEEEKTEQGFMCTECDQCFDTSNKRWKHVQRRHRTGHVCGTCGKTFAFRNNRDRHQRLHSAPPPRAPCPTCNKLVRIDLQAAHARTHDPRAPRTCRACDKTFVSRASYEHHLKYTRAHAKGDILKHKCPHCDKGFRSGGELRDHVDYRHRGSPRHQCPHCGKALATRRCITRHVRRAHRGIKENARDKICQQCGKAFRDKKGLREHELTHTGERPLSCSVCGCSFRQSASLYTHRRRVHQLPGAGSGRLVP